MDQVWEAWERLADKQSNFFATLEWNRLWLGHWRSEATPLFFLFHQAGRPVALFPLILVKARQRGLMRRKLEILATPHLPEWLIDGPVGPIVTRWLDELISLGGWDVLRLGEVPAEMPGLAQFTALLDEKGFQWREDPVAGAPITAVDGDFEGFWGSRSRNLRKKVGKMWRHAEREGRLEFSVSRPSDDPEVWSRRVMDIAAHSWKAKEGSSLAQGPDLAFYPEALRLYLPRGQARFYMLSLGGMDIAYYLGFIWDGTFFNLKTDYRSDFSEFSPGIILLKPLMEHCFADPDIRRVNFLTELPFNVRWATEVQPLRDLTVAGRGLRAKAIWRAGNLRRALFGHSVPKSGDEGL
ncbi:MAG: GNAT family N-acetyltransferase [Proteobacteria bacterium]|nr:GNAT family N-acetyltransferase [Pseudomonadota bacterium]